MTHKPHAFAGKVFDRMSKGVREAPGKALIGELAAASGDRPEGAFGGSPGVKKLDTWRCLWGIDSSCEGPGACSGGQLVLQCNLQRLPLA